MIVAFPRAQLQKHVSDAHRLACRGPVVGLTSPMFRVSRRAYCLFRVVPDPVASHCESRSTSRSLCERPKVLFSTAGCFYTRDHKLCFAPPPYPMNGA